ncbi:SurA N-terminal domain-containing protein [Pararhizobium haloflavum]|uniref:SurA N-terminal domain-containing protein n=1 Tax=Pararhizobium haloflavum TaxID=2037914 RepID=UPI000C192275|nr:SurA N-terminal domain-containing protein [Pararhizobium haloflavum]
MTTRKNNRNLLRTTMTGLVLAASVALSAPLVASPVQAASEVAIVVNNQAITTGDVQRRAAFLRLQRTGGDLNAKAREQLVDEAIQMQEAQRIGAVVGDDQVDQSVQRFADDNNLSQAQLQEVLNRAGVGIDHFRRFVRAQMTWPRVVSARYSQQNSGGMSQEDLVSRMLERGEKPTTTEYVLQQVIFVVPDDRRSAILGQRQREAEQMRGRFTDCGSTRQFAAQLRDVSVRDLGRVMQPELPADWKEQIEATSQGGTTPVRATERGAEFIAICSAQQVSDDLAAEMVFRAEDQENQTMRDNADKFLAELKEKAAVSYR